MLNDKDFLTWIHNRLELVHHEPDSADYMHRLRKIISSMETPIPNPFPKPTPEIQCLRNVSQLLYDAWGKTDKDSISTPLIEEAYDITWNAYVAVRKLLGDEVK